MIVGGVIATCALVLGAVFYMQSNKTPISDPPKTDLGKVVPSGQDANNANVSEATRAKLNRVQTAEAEAARRAGRSYIPEVTFEKPESVTPGVAEKQAEPPKREPGPGRNQSQEYRDNQRTVTGNNPEAQLIQEGLVRQIEQLNLSLRPATTAVVAIAQPQQGQQTQGTQRANAASVAAGATDQPSTTPSVTATKNGSEIIGGLEIVAAVLTTPINTDTSKFALAEVVGGPLSGAILRGEVVPIRQSGDIEDVGIKFTTMRFKDKMYKIDAMALNEKTASDAMGGDVDRKLMTRYVMPVLMAGLSGAATYFTALGTPATSVAPSATYGNGSIIVNQNAATADQAMNQGIGRGVDKAAQMGERTVDKLAQRPNKVTLDANTPIGVIFNAPVLKN